MVKSSLKKLSTNYPTQVKIFYRKNHFFSSRTNLPNWATPHPSWTWGAPRASTRPRSRGASKSPVSSQNPRARHSTRPMKYSCSNHPTIRTSFSHIVFLRSVLKWLPSSWNWNRLVIFHRHLLLFLPPLDICVIFRLKLKQVGFFLEIESVNHEVGIWNLTLWNPESFKNWTFCRSVFEWSGPYL